MNHEIEAHFAQYCYLLKSEDDAPGWSFAAEHADNRGIAIQMLSTYINNKRRLLPDMSPEYVNGLIENNIVNVFRKTDAYKDYPYDNSRGVEFDFEILREIVSKVNHKVIAEGNINTPEKARRVLKMGAYSVVVGSIITRPQLITKSFVEAIEK